MSSVSLGRPIRRVRYYTLPDAAWDRHPGVHDLDFGFDLDLDGETWGFIWKQRTGTLDVLPRSFRNDLPDAESLDASSVWPWADVLGAPLLEVTADGNCLLRLVPEAGKPIWVAAGNSLTAVRSSCAATACSLSTMRR